MSWRSSTSPALCRRCNVRTKKPNQKKPKVIMRKATSLQLMVPLSTPTHHARQSGRKIIQAGTLLQRTPITESSGDTNERIPVVYRAGQPQGIRRQSEQENHAQSCKRKEETSCHDTAPLNVEPLQSLTEADLQPTPKSETPLKHTWVITVIAGKSCSCSAAAKAPSSRSTSGLCMANAAQALPALAQSSQHSKGTP